MTDGVTWQLDPQNGDCWPVTSDAEMSEVEVEEEVGRVGEEVRRTERDSLDAARELIRTEVCRTFSSRLSLCNVRV